MLRNRPFNKKRLDFDNMQGYIVAAIHLTMTMKSQKSLLTVAALLLALSVFGGVVREGSLSGRSDGNTITIRWLSEDETGVLRYVLERKAGANGMFMQLAEIQPKGNNESYQYIDDTAFRVLESIYQYRLKVLFIDGSAPMYYGPITVSHRTSDVRRTWGSIKAMFR